MSDSLSHLLSASNPESGNIAYAYDADGNVITKTAPLPNQTGTSTATTTYSYDKLNRLTQKSYSDGYTATARYGYDNVALSGCTTPPPSETDTYPIGRRTSMCDGSGGTSWAHDTMGRVLQERRKIGPASTAAKYVSYTFNLDGSLNTVTTAPERSVAYTYSGAGRPTTMADPGDSINFAKQAVYAPPGGLTGATWGSSTAFAGFTVANAYNSRLQPILRSATNAATSATVFGECFNFNSIAAVTAPSPCSFAAGSGDNGNVSPDRQQSGQHANADVHL